MKYRCAGSQVVSVLAFYSYDPSSNLTHVFSFFCKICIWKDENKQKRPALAYFLKKYRRRLRRNRVQEDDDT